MSCKKEIDLLSEYAYGDIGLNIGCGNVQIGHAAGVDIDPEARAKIFTADAANLPFPAMSQDFIVSAACLEHQYYAPILILREWVRVLIPNGLLAVTVPDGNYGIWSMTGNTGKCGKLAKKKRPMEHLHSFTKKDLLNLFTFAGMDVKRCESISREPERRERILLCVGRKNNSYEKADYFIG